MSGGPGLDGPLDSDMDSAGKTNSVSELFSAILFLPG